MPDVKEEAMALLDAEVAPTDVTTPTPLLPVATIEPLLLPPTPASLLFSLCDKIEVRGRQVSKQNVHALFK